MMKILACEPEYLDEVLEIEGESFSVPWTREMFEAELDSNDALFYICVDEDSEGVEGLENKEKSRILGYVNARLIIDEVDILNIAVNPSARRRGVARLLLKSIFDRALARGASKCFLEVRMSNVAAISLYESMGFKKLGIRKGYYEKPKEDAIIMLSELDS